MEKACSLPPRLEEEAAPVPFNLAGRCVGLHLAQGDTQGAGYYSSAPWEKQGKQPQVCEELATVETLERKGQSSDLLGSK